VRAALPRPRPAGIEKPAISDARWFEVDEDVAAAVKHFGMSADLFAAGGFDGDGIGAYRAQMALMHAMQSGHTSLESALVRILDLLGEEAPSGKDWHADLIKRASHEIAGRPAILPPDLARAAGETRRFCHVAMKGYGSFDMELSRPSVLAASFVAQNIGPAISSFRTAIDPATKPPEPGAGPRTAHDPGLDASGRPAATIVPKIAARSRRERAITRPRRNAGRLQPGRIRPRSGSPRR